MGIHGSANSETLSHLLNASEQLVYGKAHIEHRQTEQANGTS